MTENIYDHTFTASVDPAFGFRRVVARVTIPKFPANLAAASFGEHIYDRVNRRATSSVIVVRRGGVSVSDNLGDEWQHIELAECKDVELVHCFTLTDGTHLLQGRLPKRLKPQSANAPAGRLFRYSSDWKFLGESHPGECRWHGSRSVDESAGVIMFADYPINRDKYLIDLSDPELVAKHKVQTPKVYRSLDAGQTWSVAFSQAPQNIRHFHTLMADPYAPSTWWLSSGDRAEECRVWISTNSGDTWEEVSQKSPSVELHPSVAKRSQAVFRHTDMLIDEHEVCWGTDDWLGNTVNYVDQNVASGPRVGSRMYRAAKSYPLVPKLIGYVGNPVRSIIDIGPACIIMTEAKQKVLSRPQILLLSRRVPDLLAELFTIDVVREGGTGFTFSRTSRAACNGTFFTYRSIDDFMGTPTRMVRWQIELE